MYNEMETLTKQLVSISSVNSKPEGEAKIAEFIYGYFKNLPYFQEHPEYLCTIPLKNDPLQRKMCLLCSVVLQATIKIRSCFTDTSILSE